MRIKIGDLIGRRDTECSPYKFGLVTEVKNVSSRSALCVVLWGSEETCQYTAEQLRRNCYGPAKTKLWIYIPHIPSESKD